MQVLVFEPKYVGHFLGFATYAVRAFERLGHQVTLAVAMEAEGSVQAREKLAALPAHVGVEYSLDVPKCYDKWKSARTESEALAGVLAGRRIDRLVVPSGDFLLCGLLPRRSLRRQLWGLGGVDLILHNPCQIYPGRGKKERIRLLADRLALDAAGRIRVHSVDPYVGRASRFQLSLLGRRVPMIPHPFDRHLGLPAKREARLALGLPEGECLIGSIGDLGVRKGTELLIRSFAESGVAEEARLVLFGLLSGSVRAELERHRELVEAERIVVRNEFVAETVFQDFFAAVDLVWAGYPRQIGIASVLLYAADAGVPVLASDFGCVGWMTREYGLGRALEASPEAMSRALREFVAGGGWEASREGIERLLGTHSTANFEQHLAGAS